MPQKRKRPKDRQIELFAPAAAPEPSPAPVAPPVERALRPPMMGRDWLLADPKIEPKQTTPGTLLLHAVPMMQLQGSQLAWFQLLRYDMDPMAHRVMALVRAAPVSVYPGVSMWLPAGETLEIRITQEASFPIASTDEQIRWNPQAEDLIRAAAEREAAGPDAYSGWLAEHWSDLERMVGGGAYGDSVLQAFQEAGIDWRVPSLDAWPRIMVDTLVGLGSKPIAIQRLLAEMGMQNGQVASLLPTT